MDAPSHPPLVDVLVVSHNSRALLADCLQSIERHRPRDAAVSLQVSVFDNASRDGSAELVASSFPHARLVRSEKNVGFAAANNALAATSTAQYLMLLNPDTFLVEDIVTPLLATLEADPRIALVAPALEYPDGRPQYSSERFPTLRFEIANALHGTKLWSALRRPCGLDRVLEETRRSAQIASGETHDADFVWAACWLLPSEDVRAAGLFDERFFVYDEDLDFCRRVRESGRRIVWVGSARLVHHGGASSTPPAKQRLVRSSRLLYYRRHEGAAAAGVYAAVTRAVGAAKVVTAFARSHHLMRPSADAS